MPTNTFLSSAQSQLLPPTITGPIFQKATELSAVQQLARKVPLSLSAQTVIPVMMDVPVAGWVSEGGVKPVGSEAVGTKNMSGKKVALLLPVSQELAMTNPAGLYDQMQADLPTAIARAFDHAAIHGKDLKSGGAGPFTDYLAQTSNTQTIGASTASDGGAYTDLTLGLQKVVDGPIPYNFSGFAADPRLKPSLMLSVDTMGRPLWVDQPQSGLNAGTLLGYPAFYNNGVSGRLYRGGNAVQVVTINGVPTGGTFTLTIAGTTTSGLAYNASSATVQTAVRATGGGASDATVSGSTGGPYTVTFIGDGEPISANGSSLTGGTNPSVTVAQSPDSDTGLRAIGGDFSQCAWGQGMDITFRISTEANYYDGANWHSAFQENLILLLVEAYYGFVVNDPNAFVSYVSS